MTLRSRTLAVVAALLYATFASVAVSRHFSGHPDAVSRWLSAVPMIACGLMLVGLWAERWLRTPAAPPAPPARLVQWLALLLISWRSLWMLFSWDGLFYLPVWCLLALALVTMKSRAPDCA